MSTRSAAGGVEDSPMLGRIHQRLFDFLAGLPATSRGLLEAALLPTAARASRPSAVCRNDFYWLLIPQWLADDSDRATADLLWAQYCIYSLFRVQDDVVDGDASDLHLAVAANHLHCEASTILRRHLPADGDFWQWFREAIAATSDALVEIDRRQLDPTRDGRLDRPLYARLSRSLTIGTRAVCRRLAEPPSWRRLLRVLDNLAVAGQILDDFHDLRSDLRRGRCNYVAWEMTRPVFAPSSDAMEAIIASNLATTGRAGQLLGCLGAQLAETRHQAKGLAIPEIVAYIGRFERTVSRFEESLAKRSNSLTSAGRGQSTIAAPSYTAATA